MTLKPSAAPFSNQRCMRSAISTGGSKHDVMAAAGGNPQGKLADRQLFPSRQFAQEFGATAQLVRNRQVRQGAVEIVVGKAMADPLLEQGHGAFDLSPAVENVEFLAGCGRRSADHRQEARHDRDGVRLPAETGNTALEALVEGLRLLEVLLRSKDDVGGAGG